MSRVAAIALSLAALIALAIFSSRDEESGRFSPDRSAASANETPERESPRANPVAADASPTRPLTPIRDDTPVGVPPGEIPPAYRGPVRLHGVVVDRDDTPAVGAHVHVRLDTVRPYSDAQREYLHTRTDRYGNFEFPSLPRATRYHLVACQPFQIGVAGFSEAPAEPIRLVLSRRARYHRLAVFDEWGSPIPMDWDPVVQVSVTVNAGAFGQWPFVWESWDFDVPPRPDGLIPAVPPLAAHERVALFADSAEDAVPDVIPSESETVFFLWSPGHQSITPTSRPRDADEWPASSVVRLARDEKESAWVAYAIDFSGVRLPSAWRHLRDASWIPGAGLHVVTGSGSDKVVGEHTSPFRPMFSAGKGERFSLVPSGVGDDPLIIQPIEYRIEGTRVIPEWPAYAFLTIRWNPDAPGTDPCRGFLVQGTGDVKDRFVSVTVHPGLAVAGPLRPAAYQLIQSPVPFVSPDSATRSLGRLEAGHYVVDWEE